MKSETFPRSYSIHYNDPIRSHAITVAWESAIEGCSCFYCALVIALVAAPMDGIQMDQSLD